MRLERLAGCVIINNGKILLVKEKKDWYWKLPGGRLEEEETAEECAIREAKEEANIDVELLRLFGTYNYNFKNRNFELTAYEAKILSGNPHVTKPELEAVDWFPIESLTKGITPLDRLIYDDLVRSKTGEKK